jgi:hypothetical protein
LLNERLIPKKFPHLLCPIFRTRFQSSPKSASRDDIARLACEILISSLAH